MTDALTYTPGYLPILHNLRDEAQANGNRALEHAASVLIIEYIAKGDKSEGAQRLRKQAVKYYKKHAGI